MTYSIKEKTIPVIFCDNKHIPVSIILPFDSYFHQSRRVLMQVQAKRPTNKSLWKKVIQSKITQQGLLLEFIGKNTGTLFTLSKQVKSDDSTNCEGQAARFYFKEIFGNTFLRRQELEGINSLLNYGYTVFRAAMARAVVSAGLNPSLGIKHCNPNNGMPLVDDLIEPFRSFVDAEVFNICIKEGKEILDQDIKTRLVNSLSKPVYADNIVTTPNQLMYKLSSSLGKVYHGGNTELYLPKMSFEAILL